MLKERTIKECFDFGFEEMKTEQLYSHARHTYHLEDFMSGRPHASFFNYSVNQYEKEFGVIVSFT